MRHISFIAFIVLMLCHVNMVSQPCLPEGITFTSQSQVDSFPIKYPNCTEIEGFVTINGSDIDNLNGLNGITVIDDDLSIGIFGSGGNNSLTSLTGLNSLEYIGESLFIYENDNLLSLSGLENLSYIGGYLAVQLNGSLPSLTGIGIIDSVQGVYIANNNSLQSLEGLESITFIEEYLHVKSNPDLETLNGLENLIYVGTGVNIMYNYALTDLDGLLNLTTIGLGLDIINNTTLQNLEGLINLISFTGILRINGNVLLTSLEGLNNIDSDSIMGLTIANNHLLSECEITSICNHVLNPIGELSVFSNAQGCNDSLEIAQACTVGTLERQSESLISAYPNPFTTSTAIEFALNGNSKIQISIFNAIGEEVYQFEETYDQGTHNISWSPSHLPGGLYFAVLRTEEGVSVVKMVKQ